MASSFLCGNISTLVLILGSKAKRLGKRKHCNSGPSILPNKDLRVQLSLLGTFLELSAISAVSGFEICRKTESNCNCHLSAIIWHGIAESIKEGKINSHEKNRLNCPFVRTNTADPVHFTLTPPECSMEMRTGYALNGPRVSGPVRVGDPLTLIINMRSNFGE